jgi:hypothetical protein
VLVTAVAAGGVRRVCWSAGLACVVAIAVAAPDARADLLNHELLQAHVDATFARIDVASLDDAGRERLYARRAGLVAATLIPGLGTYRIEKKVFGSLRPAGVIFDWFVGGIAPAALGITALATDGRTRTVCGWSALGLYASTRLAILVIANLHISAYNRAVRLHLGSIDSGHPALAASMRW